MNEKKRQKLKNIVWFCSEAVPYAKSGGLADVSWALPYALAERGHKVSVIMPFYPQIMGEHNNKLKVRYKLLAVPFGNKTEWAQILEDKINSRMSFYFIEYHRFYDRPFLYESNGKAYEDNPDRFIFLSRASMQAILAMKLTPDIIHTNDWHTALVCVYRKSNLYSGFNNFSTCASVLTIHNIAYQGNFHKGYINLTGLGWEYFHYHCLEYYDSICLLKGGISMAHMVNTVSPTYALETLSPEYGFSLDASLRERAMNGSYRGIINGINVDEWNPETDKYIAKKYTPKKIHLKAICKTDLQEFFGLPQNPNIPLCGIVSRLAYQKGIDVFSFAVEELLEHDNIQFVILGAGENWLESRLQYLAWKYPKKISVKIGYNNKLSHMIEAGSDFFIMPSRYEPCGLNQMYSMRYGTAPIVRATGGLDDTVINYDASSPEKSTGFKFWELTPASLLNTIRWAVNVYQYDKSGFEKMRSNMMAQDFSWNHTASEYEKLYDDAIARI